MKKIIFVAILVIPGFLLWYLFLKPYDYLITFHTETNSGTVNQSLKLWTSTLDQADDIDQIDLYNLSQQFRFSDSLHVYNWKIIPLTDSTSKVKVYIKDKQYSTRQKITVPFIHTDFKKRSKATVIDFAHFLNDHRKNIKIQVRGIDSLKQTFAVCISLKKSQPTKAQGMMEFYPSLTNFIIENELEPDGQPFIEVRNWNMDTDSLYYDFCFPIKKQDSLPSHKLFHYKTLRGSKALKAEYNGNYITSDRAWYALLLFAERNDIAIAKKPVEIFYNNPNMGGDALQWKAEIFMPIK